MLAFIILAIIDIIILMKTGQAKKVVEEGEKGWTVYGTKGCGWTVKQVDYMKKAGKHHVFVDCEKGGCDGMKAFPTLKGPNGEKSVGYKEV